MAALTELLKRLIRPAGLLFLVNFKEVVGCIYQCNLMQLAIKGSRTSWVHTKSTDSSLHALISAFLFCIKVQIITLMLLF